MRLIKLKILPRGDNGWRSEELSFGQEITQLFGPNGIGKSPLIKAAIYCLGYPSQFREDIYLNCRYAELEFEVNGNTYIARRDFHATILNITVTDKDGNTFNFRNELDYSRFLFEKIGFEAPLLVSSDEKKAVQAYFSSILPVFYLDQDEGYRKFYSPPGSFVKDQLSECLRIILGIPPKNSFNAKKDLLEAKRELEAWDKSVYTLKKEYEALQGIVGKINQQVIDEELESLYNSLEQLKSNTANKSSSTDAIDDIIVINRGKIRAIEQDKLDINKRQRSFQKILAEIKVEIDTLNLNEQAKRVFTSFDEICNAEGCKLFSFSSESYGKNLLYLKDQLKDLERNVDIGRIRYAELSKQREELISQTHSLIERRNALVDSSEIGSLVEAITLTSSRIFELEQDKKQIDIFNNLGSRYTAALVARENALTRKEELTKSGQTNPTIIKFRADLKISMLRWLDILDTNNISADIRFQDDFIPTLGNENLSQLGGSTRIRVILAYHAALLESFCEFNRNLVSFIIFDTPKQHEMHGVDLGRFIDVLQVFARAKGIQIIISGTEYRHKIGKRDIEWLPQFQGKKQKMYLKS
ncbi:AAA family ATPase [Pseudomonas sp. BN411]|uniref:AAA family ATPase n=1 Tax=Pseudomonas sp. BN411 TaxID=2567887 RepID=UPI0024564037|nr:AAA family ATPase [Pseudomonas sp. BN411]MDH4560786.1 hypothetical protein [Pseudomonas sp. BN411]